MPYRDATTDDVEFFREQRGWLVVDDAVDPADLAELDQRCDEIIDDRQRRGDDGPGRTTTATSARSGSCRPCPASEPRGST